MDGKTTKFLKDTIDPVRRHAMNALEREKRSVLEALANLDEGERAEILRILKVLNKCVKEILHDGTKT
jgi:hypothetical protein